ncbi:uncharacterized protein LOC128212178 [Mya arenaria]|uniref:uncharacterized protein LOC128212178 n=1 Tax=Mya arenaria TaxID=6604 RepID=UPI0022E7629F|nr:uncharacterized protein LOC128212178 [Mya arenaria]XP_052773449.1 uncharacterized protein LOC128212178 [Mya arenaria]XP_052773450.1 uncharacterized protein LOC128212178 [Mya arenaria]XP_052773451.1 uncharacterized protein LOC128212178 [Mya arenaria]
MTGVFSKLYNGLRDHIQLDRKDREGIACVFCTTRKRITHFEQIGRGNHITIGGQHFMFNIGDRQISPYTHHAIVKNVQLLQEDTASVTLIHFFSTPFSEELEIIETTELLNLLYHEIYLVCYHKTPYTPDQIVDRAEDIVKEHQDVKYSLLNCNCEHFCNWCSVGNEESFQMHGAKEVINDIASGVINVGGKVLRSVCKLIALSLDDAAMAARTALVWTPWGVLAIVAVVFLIYTVFRHKQLGEERAAGKICASCCRRQRSVLWAKFISYCGLQVGGLALLAAVITAGASTGIVVGAMVVCGVFTICFTHLIPKMRKLFFSPFQGSKHKVHSLKKVWIGDIVSFDHKNISHEGIVSSVVIYKGTRKQRGKLRVIHYSSPSLFGRRIITEDEILIDLSKDRLVGHNYSGYKTHPPELVVQRAQQRIGETKFGLLSNRSCHFCHWAKLDEDINMDIETTQVPDKLIFLRSINPMETISNMRQVNIDHHMERKHSSKGMGKQWAKIRDDVKPGQIIEFKWRGFWHKAISTEVMPVRDCISKLAVKVVHYGANQPRRVIEETFKFDLRYEDIWIYMFHPMYRFQKEEVIKRARSRIGEGKYNLPAYRSVHFAEEVVKKDRDQMIQEIDELKPGDAITFYYWGLKHDAIATAIEQGDSKANDIGKVRVIHYALDSIFGTRTIKEESITMSLNKDHVFRKSFEGYVTYPADRVIKRARSRLGEQRFNRWGNRSSHFVFWSMVVQSPARVAFANGGNESSREEIVLLPRAGKVYKDFQIFEVHAWSDLKKGSIVQYNYYWITHQGILSAVDETRETIKVIHYGAKHLFATRTIIEDEITLHLKRDRIQIYRCHPSKCNKPDVVVAKAKARLGETDWRPNNRSLDFCLACLFKKTNKED